MSSLEFVNLDMDDLQLAVSNQHVSARNTDVQCKEVLVESSEDQIFENLINGDYEDLNGCYEAYNHYAYIVGFSVRKGKQYYYSGTRIPKMKMFFCSCEGEKIEKSSAQVAYNKFDIRTNCEAKISFAKGQNGRWRVNSYVTNHNHILALPHERHYLRSHRHISKSTGELLESFVNSGIKPVDGISYFIEESGGHQNVSFIPKDAYNYLHSIRKTKLEEGDAGGLLSYFRRKKEEDPIFDWDFELDEDGRLANLFWRDGKSRLDYDYFGDVVSFDTTYRTNKYGLKCAVFVGVNNHWKNVILGCAFLSWETTESFEWLFETFLRMMGWKQPKTIFTDQAQAIINAVDSKLPETRHRLCQWHISQNATSHVGSLKENSQFWDLLHKCFSKCDTEDEFEQTWTELRKLDPHEDTWLDRLYGIRHKWSTAFNNDVFNAGIKSTSRSESTNRVLNGISDLTTSLYDFVIAFEKKILGKWRENERYDDYSCNHKQVPRTCRRDPLLSHASRVYTHAIYNLFEDELTSIMCYGSSEIFLGESKFNVEVFKKTNPGKRKTVFVDMDTLEVRCPCKKFESMGILCRHCLRVFDVKNVTKIPEGYIVKRWRKDVRDPVDIAELGSGNSGKEIDEPDILYSNRAMRFSYSIICKSRAHKEARNIIWKHLTNANKELNELLKEKAGYGLPKDDGAYMKSTCGKRSDGENADLVLDPLRTRPRGEKNKRKKSHLEKQQKQSGKGKRKKAIPSVDPSTNLEVPT